MTQIVSYRQIEDVEGFRPQNGMYFKPKNNNYLIVLMPVRDDAPYQDEISEDGKIIVYEGHNLNKRYCKGRSPNTFDQPLFLPNGKLTENGKFAKAANYFKDGLQQSEKVRAYQKIKKDIWAFNGIFDLVEVFEKISNNRIVHKFELILTDKMLKVFMMKIMGYQMITELFLVMFKLKFI